MFVPPPDADTREALLFSDLVGRDAALGVGDIAELVRWSCSFASRRFCQNFGTRQNLLPFTNPFTSEQIDWVFGCTGYGGCVCAHRWWHCIWGTWSMQQCLNSWSDNCMPHLYHSQTYRRSKQYRRTSNLQPFSIPGPAEATGEVGPRVSTTSLFLLSIQRTRRSAEHVTLWLSTIPSSEAMHGSIRRHCIHEVEREPRRLMSSLIHTSNSLSYFWHQLIYYFVP